jgi:hypothetical protein
MTNVRERLCDWLDHAAFDYMKCDPKVVDCGGERRIEVGRFWNNGTDSIGRSVRTGVMCWLGASLFSFTMLTHSPTLPCGDLRRVLVPSVALSFTRSRLTT